MSRNSVSSLSPTQFVLLLHSVPHLGEKTISLLLRKVAQQRLTPEAFLALSAEEWTGQYEMDIRATTYLATHQEKLFTLSADLARLPHHHPLQILTTESATYPANLIQFEETPPPILYALGNHSLLEPQTGRFTFTIAVSNGATPAVLAKQDSLATELVLAGGVPVTGHDRPPYKRLALAAQRRNRPTLYVLDRGMKEALGPELDRPPFAAARIREAVFEAKRDLVLSPFRMEDHGLGANNRRRDSLVFALSDVIIVLDVRAGGGMSGESLRAQQQGRPVFVAPDGREGNDLLRTAGCPALPSEPNWAVLLRERQKP